MARYPLNLPSQLKQDAETWAGRQGISLNQFVLWAVAEKVGALAQCVDDPKYPLVTYRRGASGQPTPVIRGTGIRVQTIVIAANRWGMRAAEIAENHDLTEAQVRDALAFYDTHRTEIDTSIRGEDALEAAHA